MSSPFENYLRFALAGLANSVQTGGIVPSQRFLIEKMIEPVPADYRGQIIELGAGNGALTVRLAARCPGAQIIACELNPALACDTRRNVAAAGYSGQVEVVSDSAERLLSRRIARGSAKPDFIISGIPLANLDRPSTVALIDLIGRALATTGLYIQFQHSLMDRAKIRARFSRLRTVPVLLNFPPAVVYYAQRPLRKISQN
jgi:phosphatidylethanolamine/phosphatidyl-N-methylethanolamine N-methyltransferase